MMSASVPGKLNKSFSESELNRLNFNNLRVQEYDTNCERKASVTEEIYQHSSTVLRSDQNYQSIPCHLHDADGTHSKNITFSRFLNTHHFDNRNAQEQSEIQSVNSYYDSCDQDVPMEIDLSDDNQNAVKYLDEVEKMDIDMDHHINSTIKKERLNSLDTILTNRNFKKELLTLSQKEITKADTHNNPTLHKKNRVSCNFIIILITLISLSILFYICLFRDGIIFVNNDIQLQNIQNDLLKNVYGQKGPIEIIIQSLHNRSYWTNKIKVLGFIGPSGVGKTFVSSILKKHFNQRLIFELYGINFDFNKWWENAVSRLRSCCLNLIIIDDLNKKDTPEFITLVNSLPKNYYILIIAIFSIQNSDEKLNPVINFDDIDEIRGEFEKSDVFHELAVFHQFDNVQVGDWLEKKLKVQNIRYSEKLLYNVLNNHNASSEGFKGLYSKFLAELEGSR